MYERWTSSVKRRTNSPRSVGVRCPVLPEGSLRHLAEVEHLVGGDNDGGSALVELFVAFQLGVAEDFEHPVDPSAQLIARRACPRAASGNECEQENQDPENARVISDQERPPPAQSRAMARAADSTLRLD